MLNDTINFLKEQLNTYFKSKTDSLDDKVAFIDGSQTDPLVFPLEMITPMLVNVEEERVLRSPDLYSTIQNGQKVKSQRDIHMNLLLLFVARFTNYEQSMIYLSYVIKFFQSNNIFDHQNAPSLPDSVGKLIMELTTMPLQQQNEIWNALRTTYLPSVLYKVKMVVFKDDPMPLETDVSGMDIGIKRL